MRKLKFLATMLTVSATLMLCGCVNHNAVVTVNGKAITKGEYEKAFNAVADNSMFAKMGVNLKKDPDSFMHLMVKERVINELIIKELLEQELDKKRITVSKADMEEQLKTIIDKVGSKEKFNQLLKDNGVSPTQFKKDLEEEVRIQKLIETLSVISISDNDALRFYKDNQDKFKNPDKVRASHILVSANAEEISARLSTKDTDKKLSDTELKAETEKEMAKLKEKAKKILAEVKKDPKSFAKIAKAESDDTLSAKQGGDLGFFGFGDMVEPFAVVSFSMKPNTISDVVQTPYGYHIIMVTDRVKAGVEPFNNVKEEIKDYLTTEAKVKSLQQYIETLKNNAKIEYTDETFNPQHIQKVLKEQAKTNPALAPDSQKSAKE